MKYRIDVVGDDAVEISLRLSRAEARILSNMIRSATDNKSLRGTVGKPWRNLSRAINRKVPWPVLRYGLAPRPADESGSSEVDMDHVVNGGPPYPLLRPADMAEVWPRLEAKRMSVKEIAFRLGVSRRTVNRWRSRERRKAVEGDT